MTIIPKDYINAVVSISGYNEENIKEIVGSGIIYGKFAREVNKEKKLNLYEFGMVTNRHVIDNLSKIYITAGHGKEEYELKIRKYKKGILFENQDSSTWVEHPSPQDLDIIVIPLNYYEIKKEIPHINYFRSEGNVLITKKMKEKGISEGDSISVLGFPKDVFYDLEPDRNNPKRILVSRVGSIANIQQLFDGESDQFIIDAPIFPGNSGGAVLSNIELINQDDKSDRKIWVSLIGIVSDLYSYNEITSGKLSSIHFGHNSDLGAVYPVDLINEIMEYFKNEMIEYTKQMVADIKELSTVEDLTDLLIDKSIYEIKSIINEEIKDNAPNQ
ncbi:hypothetical protein BK007_03925 [Methanobacterium subterraneum]|uniref:Trypsin-like peptidase domain-containing protein n=1 Tax=Methanobacterium subterraneum TaxID=59277 RepID=A0A2H4VAX6_9EURY|nr:hypothetical protein [Methanobacterium subterraneum]AUB55245.1 hypothetical protein BK007_03925 [Methanobacterium subterraneum]